MNDAKRRKGLSIGSALGALAGKECLTLERALALRKGRHDGIHEARKSSRRLRSVLDFLQPQADKPVTSLDKRVKQLMCGFSALRDAHVAVRTARLLATVREATLTPALMDALEHRSETLLEEALKSDPSWRHRRAKAQRIGKALESLPWQQADTSAVKEVLKRSFRRMKKARKKALEQRTIPAFHRWRRRTRQLRYQLEFLSKAQRNKDKKKKRTQPYEARIKQLSLITDRLGWRQDFEVFLQALDQLPASPDVIALRKVLNAKSVALSKASPALPKTKSGRAFVAHGSKTSSLKALTQ